MNTFNLVAHLHRQREWSERVLGPGERTIRLTEHIKKEIEEVRASPNDLEEWIDIAIIAFDGAWRAGYSPEQIAAALVRKQVKNEGRTWPDWRTIPPDEPLEHDRRSDTKAAR
jgi:hypothetical protein